MLLEARNLTVNLLTRGGIVHAVNEATYSLGEGRTLAIVGESGSGKTVMNMAPLGLMPGGLAVRSTGSLQIAGHDVIANGPGNLLGRTVGVIFQDPLSALNPSRTIGAQLAEVAEAHLGLTRRQAEARATDFMAVVGINEPAHRLKQYPHELSGGMRQRVTIAMAVIAEPKLIIADEATTALDVTVQAQILRALKEIQSRLGMAIVLISHDVGVVAGMATDVLVMYAGKIVEQGPVEDVLVTPQHPYTVGLISSLPDPAAPVGSPFHGLPGAPPSMLRRPVGCGFAERCGFAQPSCAIHVPERRHDAGHRSWCTLPARELTHA